jgi:Na+/phosphate symporter
MSFKLTKYFGLYFLKALFELGVCLFVVSFTNFTAKYVFGVKSMPEIQYSNFSAPFTVVLFIVLIPLAFCNSEKSLLRLHQLIQQQTD